MCIRDRFQYLKVSLSFVLVVVGAKMMAHGWLKAWLGEHFNFYVLGMIAGIIGTGIVASLVSTRRQPPPGDAAASDSALPHAEVR